MPGRGQKQDQGEPEIRFWPDPELTLPAATIVSTGPDPRPIAEIGRITASFSLLSALRGEQAFDEITLVDPVITIERRADGAVNWQSRAGSWRPETAILNQERPFGDITIANGRLRVLDSMASDGGSIDLAGISGTVKWPSFEERLSAQFSTTMSGEEVAWAFVCEDPLALFARRDAGLKTSLTSAP